MQPLAEQIAQLLRADRIALCEPCLMEVTKADHMAVREAVGGLALARDFDYAMQCGRCGRPGGVALIVKVSESHAPEAAGRDAHSER